VSNAHLFVEAVDTAIVLAQAVIGWLIFLATVAAVLILAAIATAVRAVWRAAGGPSWRRGRMRAWWLARRRRDYDTAA
jgi:hypothetical protein